MCNGLTDEKILKIRNILKFLKIKTYSDNLDNK
jgi:hypothetical protein